MNRGQLGIALLLSVPIGVGVTGASHVSLGELPTAILAGTTAGLGVFLLVTVAVSYESGDAPPDVVAGQGAGTETGAEPARSGSLADLLMGACLGAVVTVFTWYIPGSPVLGGILAGYLAGGNLDDGYQAGLLSGAMVPLVVLFVASIAFAVAGAQLIGRFPFGPAVAAVVAVGGFLYAAGFSAVGGRLGARVRAG